MKTLIDRRGELANSLQPLPAEQIKKAVIELLSKKNLDVVDLEHSLSMEIVTFQKWVKSQRRR